jgi:sucrose-6-phosphate hydrolase SacC (GH32 family)
MGQYKASATKQEFVPSGIEQSIDAGGQASASKGFWTNDGRYIHFTWIHGGDDAAVESVSGVANASEWDSMLSVAREMQLDADLNLMTLTPVLELDTLHGALLYTNDSDTVVAPGVYPLPTVRSCVDSRREGGGGGGG